MSSYGTDAAWQTYAEEHGHTEVAGWSEAQRNMFRLLGSEYLDGKYRSAFPGLKTSGRDQVREWPRTGATDASGYAIESDAEPVEVEYATYEAAWRIGREVDLNPDVTPATQIKRERIEGIIDTEYVTPSGPAAVRPVIAVIDAIMAPLIGGGASSFVGSSVRS